MSKTLEEIFSDATRGEPLRKAGTPSDEDRQEAEKMKVEGNELYATIEPSPSRQERNRRLGKAARTSKMARPVEEKLAVPLGSPGF